MPTSPTLLLPDQYITQATAHIKKAKTRVAFICMVIAQDTSTQALIDALADAARRGVVVDVAGDMFTYSELSGQFIPSHYYSKKVRSTTRMARTLIDAGVRFHWLGRLSITTFSGRTHSKWCVVDDAVFSFGGVNLYEGGIENVDFMFKLRDAHVADKLVAEQAKIVRADTRSFSYRSHSFVASSDSTVLIDAGFFGDSIIYRRACELAKEATTVTLVSQYCPTGKLNNILKKKDAKIYFNPWQSAHGFNRWIIRSGVWLSRQTTLYSRSNYLHAKFILFTMPSGIKIAITGSHNFVHGGVLLGTREIALETKDPAIIAELELFVQKYVA